MLLDWISWKLTLTRLQPGRGLKRWGWRRHIGTAVKHVMGVTKDPGMSLFHRLREEWYQLELNYEDLVRLNYFSASPALKKKAISFLAWAEMELVKKTFLRDDYKELMERWWCPWVEMLQTSNSSFLGWTTMPDGCLQKCYLPKWNLLTSTSKM